MPVQSGIAASPQLLSQFKELISTADHFGLLATVEDETIQPLKFLTPSTPPAESGFTSNLSLLTPYLKNDEALYVFLRRYDDTPAFLAITYVPDYVKVRQKMLFASSRLSLIRDLGREHFRDSIEVNSASELTAEGFARHDKHVASEAPLTREEEELGAVKRAEAEAVRGTGGRAIHGPGQTSMPMDDKVKAMLEALAVGQTNIVILKVAPDPSDPKQAETIFLEQDDPITPPSTISELASIISTQEPRFTFFRYQHTHNGQESSPVLFFYTCPPAAGLPVKQRMLYALKRNAVVSMAEGFGVTIDKKFEIEPAEISEEGIMGDLHPTDASRAGFARPKRPGRR